jgi:putative transcriptional regulator
MASKRRVGTAIKRDIGQEIIDGLGTFAEALRKGDDIAARFTCRTVVLDLVPSDYPPKRVRQVRAALGLSQALFAQFLGISVATVQAWEQGVKAPAKMACRFMDEIFRDPAQWQRRIRDCMTTRTSKRPSGTGA